MTQGAASGASWAVLGSIATLLLLAASLWAFALRKVSRLLRALQRAQRLRQVWIDSAEDRALLELDAAGNVSDWNAAARRLHGYEADEIVGQPYAQLFSQDERAARVPQDALEIAAREGRHCLSGWRVPRGGGGVLIETLIQSLRDGAGTLTGFALSEQDITERAQHQQALNQMRESLAQAQRMAALGRLSDGIAHEFNNVMQVISTCVQALQRHDASASQADEYLLMIRRNAERAAALSQRLLGLAARRAPNPALINVNAVVSEVVALLRQTLSEDIVVDLQVDEGLAWVVIDRADLEAALLHLAASARDAMPAGAGGTLSVSTADVLWPPLTAEGEPQPGSRPYVMISVSRIDGAAQDPGLEMVRSFAERAGGRLEIAAANAGGATARLYLPCRAA